ncbi:MAG: HAMP domain-containing sensor histidine kinase [Bacteroidota bacterium]|nr:HAMP domain-containing sensor histidine kinase [Bacteroidota bacterium]
MFRLSTYNILRISLMAFALIIAIASLYYTDLLVEKLQEREQKLIKLFAKGLETIANPDDEGNLSFLFQEIIQANTSVPVILINSSNQIISHKNIEFPVNSTKNIQDKILSEQLEEMKKGYPPIEIEYSPGLKNYIYYKNSELLLQLKYYPYIQLSLIFIFVLMGYLFINNSMKEEQNRVWVGMSKETAHQLATPLSSLMAWVEIFKSNPDFSDKSALVELDKDVHRLETITSRFSNIGSMPVLNQEYIKEAVSDIIDYLKQRVSAKVKITFNPLIAAESKTLLNKALFDWALENIIKNGIDAMNGEGFIEIKIEEEGKNYVIEINDSGKGMQKKHYKKIFEPGFTTKQRGWGLGLTLTKRIIEEYHHGKVYVKYSEIGKGTTFRVVMPKFV